MLSVERELYDAFKACGHEIYVVGGSVRDMALSRPAHDLDFATSARPETIKTILNAMDVDAVWSQGEKFGTIGAQLRGFPVEITTFRTDQYSDSSRKPDVTFGDSIEEDLARRDFTMNAMALDILTQQPIDPHGGLQDIRSRKIRFVGHPKSRIIEDPLRMLRAVRFAAQLNFSIESESSFWITSQSYMLRNISQERIASELMQMLVSKQPSFAIYQLKAHDLLQVFLPEIARLAFIEQDARWHFGNVFEHTMQVLDSTPPDPVLRLAALFHDVGKAETYEERDGRISFHKHEKVGAAIASSAMRRLHFDNDARQKVVHLVGMHMRPLSLVNSGMSTKAVRKFIRDCYNPVSRQDVYDVLQLNRADILGHKTPHLDDYDRLVEKVNDIREGMGEDMLETVTSPLDGNEIQALYPDLEPGPWIGVLKTILTNEVVCGTLSPDDKEGAKELAMQFPVRQKVSK